MDLSSTLILLLLMKIWRVNTESCPVSRDTMQTVVNCPVTEEQWRKAAERKNCSVYADQCSQPSKLVYHCVINPYVNATIEVCAYRRIIFLGHCTEYSFLANRIQQSYSTDCTNFTDSPCPQLYPSTEAYKYPGCYDLTKTPTENPTMSVSDSTSPTQHNEDMTTSEGSVLDDGVTYITITIAVVSTVILTVCAIGTSVYIYYRKKQHICIENEIYGGRHNVMEKNEENEAVSFLDPLPICIAEGTSTMDERIHWAPSGKHLEPQGKEIQPANEDETPDIAINPEEESEEDDCRRLMNALSDGLERLTIFQSEHNGDEDHQKRTAITAEKIYSSEFSNESSTEINKYISELESLENYFKRLKMKDNVFMPP